MSSMIDTHIHLDFEDFSDDLDKVIEQSQDVGVSHFVIPGASLETFQNAIFISNSYPQVFMGIGIHPSNTNEMILLDKIDKLSHLLLLFHIDDDIGKSIECFVDSLLESWEQVHDILDTSKEIWIQDCLRQFENVLSLPKCIAIGECGLDFFRLESKQIATQVLIQVLCLFRQIIFALQNNLPLILHVRDSKEHFSASLCMLKILRFCKHRLEPIYNVKLRGVFHCYNANRQLLKMSDSFYYGIGGIITFKNAKELVEILPNIPVNRILLETDAPYLAPLPYRGKRNESKFLTIISEKIGEIICVPSEQLRDITTINAKRLFFEITSHSL